MRPETLPELFIATGYLLIVAFCSYLSRTYGASIGQIIVVAGSASVLVPIFFGVRHYLRSKPYTRDIRRSDWTEAHQNSHRGVYVRIPKRVHKRGPHPQVTFQACPTPYGSDNLENEVTDNGDVEITGTADIADRWVDELNGPRKCNRAVEVFGPIEGQTDRRGAVGGGVSSPENSPSWAAG